MKNSAHPLHEDLLLLIKIPLYIGIGPKRIAYTLTLFLSGPPLEKLPFLATFVSYNKIELSKLTKQDKVLLHPTWLTSLQHCWVVHSDGSLLDSAVALAGWVVKHIYAGKEVASYSGGCCLGRYCTNEDTEIHGIHEVVTLLLSVVENPLLVYLCVDNQNALLALSGGPISNKEYLGKCLEGMNTFQ